MHGPDPISHCCALQTTGVSVAVVVTVLVGDVLPVVVGVVRVVVGVVVPEVVGVEDPVDVTLDVAVVVGVVESHRKNPEGHVKGSVLPVEKGTHCPFVLC